MKKVWLGAFVIMAAVGGVLLAQDDDLDVFADTTLSMRAIPYHGKKAALSQSIISYTSDRSTTPQRVFHPGDYVAWTSEFFVVPKGGGIQTENISIDASTPRRTRTISGSFTICNTSDPNICDDIPDETEWALIVYLRNPIPQFFNKFLLNHGPIPFSSVVTGTGYEDFVVSLDGSSVAGIPQ